VKSRVLDPEEGASVNMTKQLPKITIITPSFNQGRFIEQTIKSVLSQDYPNLEYIVMDGGSSDGTVEILKKYGDKLYWTSEKDRGQSHAINKGLHLATGEVIGFLNSDDLYEPGALLRVGRFFAEHPNASWVTGKCRIIDERGREIRKFVTLYKNLLLRFKGYGLLLVVNYISQPATFWRRDVVEKAGYFDESLHYAPEYDFWLRTGQRFKLWFIDAYLASFRIHLTSKAGSSARAQFDADLEIARRYTSSPLLIGLHKLHRAVTVAIYSRLMTKKSGAASLVREVV
jgi:glycosyltransferase involved in cell wall biosynthesis